MPEERFKALGLAVGWLRTIRRYRNLRRVPRQRCGGGEHRARVRGRGDPGGCGRWSRWPAPSRPWSPPWRTTSSSPVLTSRSRSSGPKISAPRCSFWRSGSSSPRSRASLTRAIVDPSARKTNCCASTRYPSSPRRASQSPTSSLRSRVSWRVSSRCVSATTKPNPDHLICRCSVATARSNTVGGAGSVRSCRSLPKVLRSRCSGAGASSAGSHSFPTSTPACRSRNGARQ